jgi:hypothetical protein
MELAAGAEVCPDCGVVFARRCGGCGEPVFGAPENCPHCGRALTHQVRAVARSLSKTVDDTRVRWVVCPNCKTNFIPAIVACPECGTRVCPECDLVLCPDETTCPRCGAGIKGPACPKCHADVAPGVAECPSCGQPLCPDCGAAIGEDDTSCATCGAELVLFCSECDGEVGPDDTVCPHCGEPF